MSANAAAAQPEHEESLWARFARLRTEEPTLRQRDAAERLGVSEAALAHAKSEGGEARVLKPGAFAGFGDLLKQAPRFGEVMVLTRNAHCVHEKIGEFANVTAQPSMGLVVNHDVDLRLFFNHWRHGYRVTERTRSGQRESLQFFDAYGDAVHKIYAREATDQAAFDATADAFAAEASPRDLKTLAAPAPRRDRPDADIDLSGLEAHWRALQDTHDFFALLKDFDVGRRQALRLAPDDLARSVDGGILRRLLEGAAARGAPIMCFVGNRGCIQIHTGPVKTIKPMGPWLNVLDPSFNLHLREDRIDAAWIVRKPTRDGVVTSLELFGEDGVCFAQFFGERKPGQAERADWRALIEDAAAAAV